jgi:hypothetical protein
LWNIVGRLPVMRFRCRLRDRIKAVLQLVMQPLPH